MILRPSRLYPDQGGDRARLDVLRRFARIQQRAQVARDIGRLADATERHAAATEQIVALLAVKKGAA